MVAKQSTANPRKNIGGHLSKAYQLFYSIKSHIL